MWVLLLNRNPPFANIMPALGNNAVRVRVRVTFYCFFVFTGFAQPVWS